MVHGCQLQSSDVTVIPTRDGMILAVTRERLQHHALPSLEIGDLRLSTLLRVFSHQALHPYGPDHADPWTNRGFFQQWCGKLVALHKTRPSPHEFNESSLEEPNSSYTRK